uniref:Uncharacterized protein n=1 Tax=Oryza brachyantha TaxID=4533 RepID=J3MR59_ORYBR
MQKHQLFQSGGLSWHTQVLGSHLKRSDRTKIRLVFKHELRRKAWEMFIQGACDFCADMGLLLIIEFGKSKIRDLGGEICVK